MIEVKNLTKLYGKFKAVDDVSLCAADGEVTILLGPNGAGKSTTIKSITNLLQYKGDIKINGVANSSLDAKDTFKQVAKEAVVAVINATIISLLVYIYNFIRFGATATVTYSVSISLFAVVMFASIFGTLVPMTLEKLKVDPAIATGPFISITNDIIGMMLYMGITVLLS